MATDVEQVIARLTNRIQRLEDAKRILLEEFGQQRTVVEAAPLLRNSKVYKPNGNGRKPKRSAELVEFLREHGASYRAAILGGTSIPDGSLGWIVSRHPNLFSRSANGKISLVEEEPKK